MSPAESMHFARWEAEVEADRGCAGAELDAWAADWRMREEDHPEWFGQGG